MKYLLVFVVLSSLLIGCSSTASTPSAPKPPSEEAAYTPCVYFLESQVKEPMEKAAEYSPSMVETGESGIFWKVTVYYSYNKAWYTCGIGYNEENGDYALLVIVFIAGVLVGMVVMS